MHRLPLVRCLASRDAGEVSNNSGHSATVLDDVAGVGSDAVEVGFFSDGFSQPENSEERIVQLVSDSGCEGPQAPRFLGLHEFLLHVAFVRRVAEDEADRLVHHAAEEAPEASGARLGGDVSSFVPAVVQEALASRLNHKKTGLA